MDEDELERIKKEKLQQLKEQKEASEEQERSEEQFEARKKAILRQLMTPEARERLGRVRVARPEIAENIESQIIMLAQRGAIQGKITDKTLKDLLKKITGKKKDINIKRR